MARMAFGEVLGFEPLIHSGYHDKYNKGEYIKDPQCSTAQVFNFRDIECYAHFVSEIERVSLSYKTIVCVTWVSGNFHLLKWRKFWKYKVMRVCFTGGGGTLWVIKRRIGP